MTLGTRPALAALAVVALPVPLHLVPHSHQSPPAHQSSPVQHPPVHPPTPVHHAPSGRHGQAWHHQASPARQPGWRHPQRIVVPLAVAAGDPSDTISDFQFTPGTITVHVGDTVTWTNDGPSAHTATASDHSFDTGILQKGASASHTFTAAGTYAYICSIHPFMHGSVVVLANVASQSSGAGGSGSSSAGSSTSSATSSSTASTAGGGQSLPLTGYAVGPAAAVAVLMVGLGLGLRRLSPRREHRR